MRESLDNSERLKASEKQVPDKINILQNFEGALEAVYGVEGAYGAALTEEQKYILRDAMGAARTVLQEDQRKTGFQGLGGFNRYVVDKSGLISLSRSHSIGPCVKKAREAGIEIEEF
jgi:hypothetical protein